PLGWITGTACFCGIAVRIDQGVYVPRAQSEMLAMRAVERLPSTGRAVDLGTGSGAIARVLGTHRPDASVVGTDIDLRACACAQRNLVDVVEGDLFAPLPSAWRGTLDCAIGVL